MSQSSMYEPRWRRPEVINVRLVDAEPIIFRSPQPRFCGCGKRISQLNTSTQCFTCKPPQTAYAIARGQRPAADRRAR